jgi:hypothetical protein
MNKYTIDHNNRNLNDLRGEYETAVINVNSQINSVWNGLGIQTIDPITRAFNGRSNASFTTTLTNPIVLDNNYEYVIGISKLSFDCFNYNSTGKTIAFNILLDIINYQYVNGVQQQVLHQTIPIEYTGQTTTGQISPFCDEPRNIVYRFLNTSNKVISRLVFTILENTQDQNPLFSTDPLIPTEIELILKKVSPDQTY